MQYWKEKGHITETNEDYIDFTTMAQASNNMDIPKRKFVAKWTSECIGTGKNMERWKFRYDGSCPFCLKTKETTDHILQCPHQDSIAIWDEAIIEVIQKLIKLQTCPMLITALKTELNAWRKGYPFP